MFFFNNIVKCYQKCLLFKVSVEHFSFKDWQRWEEEKANMLTEKSNEKMLDYELRNKKP